MSNYLTLIEAHVFVSVADKEPAFGALAKRVADREGGDHLKGIMGFTDRVFHRDTSDRFMRGEFSRIQEQAGIHLPCDGNHEHTEACHTYGFHDLRRAFATMNAERLTADALQKLMRHKSYQTTQLYINLANPLTRSADNLYVPECLHDTTKAGEGD